MNEVNRYSTKTFEYIIIGSTVEDQRLRKKFWIISGRYLCLKHLRLLQCVGRLNQSNGNVPMSRSESECSEDSVYEEKNEKAYLY